MEFTVTTRGPTFDQLTRDTARDLRAANKAAGRQIARKGRAAVAKGAPTMKFGAKTVKLGVKAKTEATANTWTVTFTATPAGGWAMQESGTRPHVIRPRNRDALKWGGRYAAVVDHPGTGGSGAWTRALGRLSKATAAAVADVYDKALG